MISRNVGTDVTTVIESSAVMNTMSHHFNLMFVFVLYLHDDQ